MEFLSFSQKRKQIQIISLRYAVTKWHRFIRNITDPFHNKTKNKRHELPKLTTQVPASQLFRTPCRTHYKHAIFRFRASPLQNWSEIRWIIIVEDWKWCQVWCSYRSGVFDLQSDVFDGNLMWLAFSRSVGNCANIVNQLWKWSDLANKKVSIQPI